MKITEKQCQHLQALAGGERSAYPDLNIGVLNSLARKGAVEAQRVPGAMFCPRTSIKWRLTTAGREALNFMEHCR